MKLYSTHCPKCKVLEKKLAEKNVEFELIDDIDKVIETANKLGVNSAPLLVLDTGEVLDFQKAVAWINGK